MFKVREIAEEREDQAESTKLRARLGEESRGWWSVRDRERSTRTRSKKSITKRLLASIDGDAR